MREEPRAGDVYAWSWPARPVGDDAYQWRGPVQAQLAPPPSPVEAPPAPIEALDAAPQPPIGDDVAGVDVWVELPATEEAPRKGRARRGRGRSAAAEPVIAEAPMPIVEPAVAAAPVEAEPVTAAAPEPEAAEPTPLVAEVESAAPAPVLATVNEPPPPRPVDANEIVAPPATPKRGWWRRGA